MVASWLVARRPVFLLRSTCKGDGKTIINPLGIL